ncbi:MAG: class I SAM-dependent methyltransferase [Deltaproteobacteria bacterium]|nr:class I SAM-dependent methyltransferase [Deltaproteobacteria bacterium]
MPLPAHPLALGRHIPGAWVAPVASALDRGQQGKVEAFLSSDQARWTADGDLVAQATRTNGDDPGTAELDAAVDRAARQWLARLRALPFQGDAGTWQRLAAHLDGWVRSERSEILESRWLPEPLRRFEMATLDRANRQFGSYALWADRVASLLADRPAPHVVDLAAGSGGFLRWVAAHRRDIGWRMTATDLEGEFVAQGHALAQRAGVPVQFERRDATRIGVFDPPADLFVCTQSAHHMPPGVLVRMMASAMASAPAGLWLVDIARGIGHAVGIGLGTATSIPFPPLMLDGMQSSRRAYSGAELHLLARLAGARTVMVEALGPVHVVLHAVGT